MAVLQDNQLLGNFVAIYFYHNVYSGEHNLSSLPRTVRLSVEISMFLALGQHRFACSKKLALRFKLCVVDATIAASISRMCRPH